MCAHVLGGTSLASCSNYVLRRTAIDNKKVYGTDTPTRLLRNFYVDDLLKSMKDVQAAKQLLQNVINMCKSGGFNLTKFMSNSKELLATIPEEKRKEGVKDKDLSGDLPNDKALGICWNIEKDTFSFKINLDRKPITKRGLLSMISSIYDPLGYAAPFVLEGRQILQRLCNKNVQWDEIVQQDVQSDWAKWVEQMNQLENLPISRCIQPADFGEIKSVTLHHFSDASENGYGQCSYIRLVDYDNRVHCSFLLGKSRVVPKKFISIPRLELTAALLSVKMACLLKKELDISCVDEVFWTDSKVVLGYITNTVKRFKTFVANRVQQIKEKTDVQQWRYVPTKENPADDASRGLNAARENSSSRWFQGPSFLWQEDKIWEKQTVNEELSEDDPEIKKDIKVCTIIKNKRIIAHLSEKVSSWSKMKRISAIALCYKQRLLQSVQRKKGINIDDRFNQLNRRS